MGKQDKSGETLIRITEIKKKDVWTVRLLIVCGLISMLLFVYWFIDPEHIGYQPIFWLLTLALLFKLVKMLHEWYHYWNPSIPQRPVLKRKYTVDMLTTACPGEPREMVIRTLKAMKAVHYPHTNYLCDEGNDPLYKKLCDEMGIIHVTRTDKSNAKAGNINNALKQATGEICVVLDPDHVPVPEFLDRTLPYFEDPELGFVQCVQGYGNQEESLIAKGAAEQTYHFYGPMMMCMNSYGTVQAIGANCTFRREALDSIGGHAAGLSEDMHTAMQLHAKGWKSIYIPEMLTRGLVPATLSSYYKQQLKWSRGTFELLFHTYPKLFKQFTWRQKLHYFTIPLYFLFGLINFIDILIPLLALSFAEVPWEVDLQDFGALFLPLCGLSMIIRLFAQRWLLEKHERGFHLAGGILRTATWWIFLIGFIYAIFNINVPYIPTPKEDEHQNYWKLSLPNLVIALICGSGILYGLELDWSPYSLAMAFYAFINAGMLAFIVFVSQQRFLDTLMERIKSMSLFGNLNNNLAALTFKAQQLVYGVLRNGPVAILIGSALLFLSYNTINNESTTGDPLKQKEFGGFFSGITPDTIDGKKIKSLEKGLNNPFEVIAFNEKWDDPNLESFERNITEIKKLNSIPLINWELPDLTDDVLQKISTGADNAYLEKFAAKIRAYQSPVFINFAAGFDDAEKISTGNYPASHFVKAWQFVYTFFNNLGISNISWVWSPQHPSSVNFYPGPKFVDWIGVSCLNYGDGKNDNDNYSFSELYVPFRNKLGVFQKPFMITEFGTSGEGQEKWFDEAFTNIKEKYHEIHSVVFFTRQKKTQRENIAYTTEFGFKDPAIIAGLKEDLDASPFNKNVFTATVAQDNIHPVYHSAFVSGGPGNYKLIIHGKPFYIKGVAYNTAHDWRDGNMPLTRRQVEKDMENIRAMGANTIRRYDHGIYDRNVLNIAEEYGLNVLYGFWFDPKVDYYRDSAKVQEYIREVEEKVTAYKGHSSVLAWSLGNETWGLLKHNYAKPYLTKVRQSYVRMIELLAERIHAIDPGRPVFSCMEHEEYQLPGELAAFHDVATSVDVIGINSYYKEQISRLNHVFYQFDSLRPYLVSEFGPRGYWDPNHNRTSRNLLVEDSETEKAQWYEDQWNNYVDAYKGYNIGGIAYCWHDRMEGSNTWFGITDYRGRKKLSYYALKKVWTKQDAPETPIPAFSIHIPKEIRPGATYLFSATASTPPHGKLSYEWSLNKDDYLKKVDGIIPTENESEVLVKIPEIKSNYRLYLYVSDESGNVSTVSIPIKIF